MRLSDRIRVVGLLMVGIMAIGLLTWGVGKIYLELVGQSNHEKVQTLHNPSQVANPPGDTVLSLPAVKFWTCQVGVFQNERNAQARKDQLRMQNVNAEVIGTSAPWIVGVGLGHSAEDLKGLRQFLADIEISTVPKQIILPERTFRVAGNGLQLTVDILTNVNNILKEGLTAEALVKEEQAWKALAGDYTPKELVGLHELYNNVRAKITSEEQKSISLSLFFESQRVINILCGK